MLSYSRNMNVPGCNLSETLSYRSKIFNEQKCYATKKQYTWTTNEKRLFVILFRNFQYLFQNQSKTYQIVKGYLDSDASSKVRLKPVGDLISCLVLIQNAI